MTGIKWFVNEAIPAHSTGWVSFQSQVNPDVTDYPLICNNASAGVADCPFDPIDIVCANGGADLDILKVVSDKSPCPGQEITYVVTVSNPSTTNATGVEVTDLLPSGLTHISSNTSQGTYNSGTRVWDVGNLNASTNATLTLTTKVNNDTAGQTIINSANVTHAEKMDPVLLNNSDHDGITVHPSPAAYPSSNSPVCEGSTIYLFGGPGNMTSYHWTGPGGFDTSEQDPVIVGATSAMNGTYTLTITDFSGCGIASNTTNVTVNAQPIASASSNSPVCEGGTIQLLGGPDGMLTYSWTGPGDWASDEQNPIRTGAKASMAGTHTLTVGNGCTDSDEVTVTVTECCCICGFVYRAGTTDPLAGWVVVLEKEINSWDVVGNPTTDANDRYCFCELGAGNYTVSEVVQAGWNQVLPISAVYVVTLPAGCCDPEDPESGFLNFENEQGSARSTVGWEMSPIDKLVVMAPWIMLFAVIVTGAGLLVLSRRRI